MDNQQLIASDISKKEKAVIAQWKYRLRLKSGTAGKEGSETTYGNHKWNHSLMPNICINTEHRRKFIQLRLMLMQILNLKPKHKRNRKGRKKDIYY